MFAGWHDERLAGIGKDLVFRMAITSRPFEQTSFDLFVSQVAAVLHGLPERFMPFLPGL